MISPSCKDKWKQLGAGRARLVTLTEDGFPASLPRGVSAQAASDWLLAQH